MVKITDVLSGSLAEHAGLLPSDLLLSINGRKITDVLDYRYYLAERSVTLTFLRNGAEQHVTIKKGIYDDIGLGFETPLMDKKHACKNKCIFCFIDQLPKGLRPSLYFKDDDARLSFLHGNYITLTNLTDRDIDRMIEMRFSPINISVHTTNPALRVKMMKNPRAGEVLAYIARIAEAGLRIHAQIVLCKGWNDGDELLHTMQELSRYREAIDSVSVVPAGLTRFRDGLTPLEVFTAAECRDIIACVTAFADRLEDESGMRIFACADELYVKAGLPLPEEKSYEGYPQIENGVGMMRSLREEVSELLKALREKRDFIPKKATLSIATGMAAFDYFRTLSEELMTAFPSLSVKVYGVRNRFFGEDVTVAGLLTGEDLYEALKDAPLGDRLLISESCVRNENGLFLCGMTKDELARKLNTPIIAVKNDGADFLSAVLGERIDYSVL